MDDQAFFRPRVVLAVLFFVVFVLGLGVGLALVFAFSDLATGFGLLGAATGAATGAGAVTSLT